MNPIAAEVPVWFVLCAGALAYSTRKALAYATHIWPWASRSNTPSDVPTGFEPADPPEDEDRPREGTRISKISFISETGVRRAVRRYDLWEDGADPMRHY